MRRLFIAINLPQDIKKEIAKKIAGLPYQFRWLPKENWHLTLYFLGNTDTETLGKISQVLSEIVPRHQMMELNLEKIILGPKLRMIWLKMTDNENLAKLQEELTKAFQGIGVGREESRRFSPHITLARLKNKDKIGLKESWKDINLNLKFYPSQIDLMESFVEPKGSRYQIISSYELKSD